jgi:hypothetical protein
MRTSIPFIPQCIHPASESRFIQSSLPRAGIFVTFLHSVYLVSDIDYHHPYAELRVGTFPVILTSPRAVLSLAEVWSRCRHSMTPFTTRFCPDRLFDGNLEVPCIRRHEHQMSTFLVKNHLESISSKVVILEFWPEVASDTLCD